MISDKVNIKDKEIMTDIIKNLSLVKEKIKKIALKFDRDPSEINLIVVTKRFDIDSIKPLIDVGHLSFGENKVQEAEKKWSKILSNNSDLDLHMVGSIQSNKIKTALDIFTSIHSVEKLSLIHISEPTRPY